VSSKSAVTFLTSSELMEPMGYKRCHQNLLLFSYKQRIDGTCYFSYKQRIDGTHGLQTMSSKSAVTFTSGESMVTNGVFKNCVFLQAAPLVMR